MTPTREAILRLSARAVLGWTVVVLLVLAAAGALASLRTMHRVRDESAKIRDRFLARNRLLNDLRSQLYLSGTAARDFLLDPDNRNAAEHQRHLDETRRAAEKLLNAYRASAETAEMRALDDLENQLRQYWNALQPMQDWDLEQRQAHGYRLYASEVHPRRNRMLQLADGIDALNEGQLSAGVIQANRVAASLERRLSYGLGGVLAAGLILALSALRRVGQLERDARTRYEEVQRARAELQSLSGRLVEAQEQERKSLARELHDAVGQSLSALLVGLTNLAHSLPAGQRASLDEQLQTLRGLAESSVASVRDMALLLRPSMLDDLGLTAALEWQAREVSRRAGMQVDVLGDERAGDLPESHRLCVYRIVQEALNNAARHARAHRATITLERQRGEVRVEVRDDGQGFRPDRQKGLGLLGVEERVALLGGVCRIESAPGEGTRVEARLPL